MDLPYVWEMCFFFSSSGLIIQVCMHFFKSQESVPFRLSFYILNGTGIPWSCSSFLGLWLGCPEWPCSFTKVRLSWHTLSIWQLHWFVMFIPVFGHCLICSQLICRQITSESLLLVRGMIWVMVHWAWSRVQCIATVEGLMIHSLASGFYILFHFTICITLISLSSIFSPYGYFARNLKIFPFFTLYSYTCLLFLLSHMLSAL